MSEEGKYWILLSRYISEGLSASQTEELFRWIDADPERKVMLEEAQTAWEKSKDYQEVHANDFDTNAAWNSMQHRMAETEQPERPGRIRRLSWLSAAAAVLIISCAAWFGYRSYDLQREVMVDNPLGQTRELVLPDGSLVWLNKGGSISYKKGLAGFGTREVRLRGEAFFEIAHDAEKPFIVHTGELETRVLGTSFNVNSEEDGRVKVAVLTGKVSFRKEDSEGVQLQAGEEGNYDPSSGIRKTAWHNTNFLFWKERALSFENEPLRDVLREIEAAYHIRFDIRDEQLLSREISTSFQAAPVEDVISVLESLLDLKIRQSGGAYIVVK